VSPGIKVEERPALVYTAILYCELRAAALVPCHNR